MLSELYRWRMRKLPLSQLERRIAQVEAYSMLSVRRLSRIYRGVRDVVRRRVPGRIVECGVAQGGTSVLMGLALADEKSGKALMAFDSFEGMPAPTPDGDPDYEKAKRFEGACKGTYEQVYSLIDRFGLADRATLVKGYFQETLPKLDDFPIAFLHLDADWYDSIKVCLAHLYDRVPSGGLVQIDDYFVWEGCRRATDEFIASKRARVSLHRIDPSAIWFQVP